LRTVFLQRPDDAVCRGLPKAILGDFGHAQPANNFRGIAGTTGYQAPELAVIYQLRQTERKAFRVAMKTTGYVTPAADVFSLGQSIHRLCTGREHRIGADPETLPVRDTKSGIIGVKLGGGQGYKTEALQKTVQWCLRKDPEIRPKTVEGSLLGAVAIFQEALEELESGPVIPCEMWASPP
jgi:serine/threonine protein kinase